MWGATVTLLAFLLTLLELLLAGLGYALQSTQLFWMVVKYGSPMYLFQNLLSSDSVLMSGNPFYVGMFIFHAFKYAALIRAQIAGERGALFWLAILFEATYLGLCGYYMY